MRQPDNPGSAHQASETRDTGASAGDDLVGTESDAGTEWHRECGGLLQSKGRIAAALLDHVGASSAMAAADTGAHAGDAEAEAEK